MYANAPLTQIQTRGNGRALYLHRMDKLRHGVAAPRRRRAQRYLVRVRVRVRVTVRVRVRVRVRVNGS